MNLHIIENALPNAFTIAVLAAIESLLSCVVADGMINGKHRSDMELVAQGAGNIASALFGGIPATGAIARTAANIKNGGRTPVAGMVHSITLVIVLVVLMPFAGMIPMPTIAAILFIVAYNMCQWRTFVHLIRTAPKSDIIVLFATFILTILFDLVVAIEIGMVLACLLFIKRMSEETHIDGWTYVDDDTPDVDAHLKKLPLQIRVYEITGPLFFGAADAIEHIVVKDFTTCLVLRMRSVPAIDSTAMNALFNLTKVCENKGITLVFSHVNEQPMKVMEKAGFVEGFLEEGDLNGNGEADEIPMATWFGATDTFGSYNLFYRFTGAFGCADSYCGGNAYADHLRLVDGKVTFTATDEAFKKTAEFFNMLYEEGLIWNGSFEADSSMAFNASLIKENVAKIGSFGVWGDQEITNQEVHDQYVAVPRLQGEDGMTGFECNYSELQDSSDTAITTTCKFPHVVARFVDYMVGDPEISVTSNWGAIGYNYEKDEDGILRTPLDENGNYKPLNPDYKNFGEARVNSTTCRGSMIVQNEYYDTVCGYTFDAVKLLEMQKENGKDDIMEEYDTIPRVLMTQEEIQRLAQIQPTISDIVDRYITTWVTGGVDDASWDSYKTELEGAGLNELVEIYQGAVDRAASAAN